MDRSLKQSWYISQGWIKSQNKNKSPCGKKLVSFGKKLIKLLHSEKNSFIFHSEDNTWSKNKTLKKSLFYWKNNIKHIFENRCVLLVMTEWSKHNTIEVTTMLFFPNELFAYLCLCKAFNGLPKKFIRKKIHAVRKNIILVRSETSIWS